MTQQDRDLQEYVQTRSPQAFARLVDRYIDVVHSAATRQVRNSDTAQDVTQAVFLVLAQKAGNVRPDQPLAAWLLQVTRYAASNARRENDRRNHHERRAGAMALRHAATQQHDRPDDFSWDELSPLLDEGMCKLRAKDRDVLVLRYFEKKSAREAGDALGISADAAEKRTMRAVAKLREFFHRRGVVVSGIALATGLAACSTEAAPAALKPIVAAATSSSITAPAAAASIAKGTVIAMATAKTNALIAGVIIAAVVLGSGGLMTYKALAPAKGNAVQVAATPPAGGGAPSPYPIAGPVGPPAPVTLKFSDGSAMEFVGLTDQPGKPTQWWSASGSIVPAPKPVPQDSMHMGLPPGLRLYQFVFRRVHTVKDDSVSVMLAVPIRGSSVSGDPEKQLASFIVDDAVETTNLIVGLASGPWSTPERYLVAADGIKPDAATAAKHPSLSIVAIKDRAMGPITMAVVSARPLNRAGAEQMQVSVVTKNGRTVKSAGGGGTPAMSNYNFNVPADQIVAVLMQSRPYEKQLIQNVSLRPGVITSPTTAPSTMPTTAP